MSDIDATPLQPESPEAAPEFRKVGPIAAMKLDSESVQANLSAVATVNAGSLSATGSAIGAASVDGDATITASMVPALITRGDTTVQQSYASAIIVGRGATTKVHQSATPMIVGRTVDVTQSAAGTILAGDADVKNSWVGIVISPSTKVSEDSKVIISTKAALIIGAFLLGGFGLVALAFALGVRRVTRWRPSLPHPSLPNLPSLASLQPQIAAALKSLPPELTELQQRWARR